MFLKITDIKQETSAVISLIFAKPQEFFYYPGQYLDIKLPVNDPFGNTRAFTISSSPTEDFLMITFKKGISVYKKHLENLKLGDEIETSHPAGTFTLDETEPAVFIAGGIGITPFRSMLKYTLDNNLKTRIQLVYSNKNPFAFENEINSWSSIMKNFSSIFWNTSNNIHLNHTNLPTIVYDFVYPVFYISGSEGFIQNIKQHLIHLGVDEINIRTDSFDGY